MKISRGTVATVSFVVTDKSGKVVGRTEPKHPVTAFIGNGFLISGLEKALDGHEKGDEFSITLNPHDSYGEFDENLVQEINKDAFGQFTPEVGNVFEADTDNGPIAVVVKEIKENTVVVDGNHPLAGQTLNFMVVVEDVREATEEEKKHGHAHPNGVCPSEEHEHHCCCHHHDGEEGEEHHCCHHHDGEEGEEHHCCHHHDGEEGEEHHCCHHHDGEEGEEHHCCHHHDDEEGEYHCCHHHE